MKTFYVEKQATVIFKALIQAETEEEADEIAMNLTLDDFAEEMTCAETVDFEETNADEWDLPIHKKKED